MNKKVEYVSFDIFDTLVYRCVSRSTDIFKIVENYALNNLGGRAINNFSSLRIAYEVYTRKQKKEEISIDDIYREFEINFGKRLSDKYKEFEENIECCLAMPNPRMKKAFEKYIAEGMKVIIISDMYLPRMVIEKILHKCGYKDYYKLFLSNEYGCRKSNGLLYDAVRRELNASKWSILHIGDNIKSDYYMALSHGVQANLIKKRKYLDYSNQTENIVENFLIINQKSDISERLGYSVFGPFLYGYLKWLHMKLKNGKYDNVFFMSRDGYFMKEAYETFYGAMAVPSNYLYVSRRLLQVAALWKNPSYESVMNSMYLPKYFSLSWLLDMLGVDTHQVHYENSILCKTFDRDHIEKGSELYTIYESITPVLIENSKREYEALIKHLKNINLQGRVAIIDVGWIGNMQKHLSVIAKDISAATTIDGYYVGVMPDSPNVTKQSMKGYIFQNNFNAKIYGRERFMENIFELFFIAPHGSAKKYVLTNENKVKINLYESEYNGTETWHIFHEIQKNALNFVCDFKPFDIFIDNSSTLFYDKVINTFTNPSCEVAKYIGNIKFWDKNWYKLASPQNMLYYIMHPYALKKDLINSYWKPGFLKLLMKLPIDYGKALSFSFNFFK